MNELKGGYCDNGRLPPHAWNVPELGGKKATKEIICAVCLNDHNGRCARKEKEDAIQEGFIAPVVPIRFMRG